MNNYYLFLLILCQYSIFAQAPAIEVNILDEAIVGNPVRVEVNASAADGVNIFYLWQNFDNLSGINQICNDQETCRLETTITQDFEGPVSLYVAFLSVESNFIADTIIIDFKCPKEYCEPDPILNDFFSWMRIRGYDECIIEKHHKLAADPKLRGMIKSILSQHPNPLDQQMTINFYDIIPTDSLATFESLDLGEGDDCVTSNIWSSFCPDPKAVDYLFIEDHFRKTFGIDINFNYIRREISYAEEIGEPYLIPFGDNNRWRFPSTFPFERDIPRHSIVHYAITSWDEGDIVNLTGASHVAKVSKEIWSDSRGPRIYTHEWGHTFGMSHSFYPNFPPPGQVRRHLSMDGIMSNSYRGISKLRDPLSPLERYVFEPEAGYLDQDSFAIVYNTLLDPPLYCGSIDPALVSLHGYHITEENYILDVIIDNYGDINAAFVSIGIYDTNGELIDRRTIETIAPNTLISEKISVPLNALSIGDFVVKIDDLNEINEEVEENNSLSSFYNPLCANFSPILQYFSEEKLLELPIIICEETTITVNVTTEETVSYEWSNGTLGNTATLGLGTHALTLTNSDGCTWIDYLEIVPSLKPAVHYFSQDEVLERPVIICEGEKIVVRIDAGEDINYQWSNYANSNTVNIGAGTYNITLTNDNGCQWIETFDVIVQEVLCEVDNLSCRTRDSLLLVELYNATAGENWDNTWDLTQPIDTWYGISLNTEGCVECLSLSEGSSNCSGGSGSGNGLVGILPPELGYLSALKSLVIRLNPGLEGVIPSSIGNLQQLEVLNLYSNNFTGGFPTSILDLTNLQQLNLSYNNLGGEIPKDIDKLTNLVTLGITFMNLSGSIPDKIGNLSKLTSLNISRNELSGAIPTTIGNLSKLTSLYLANNNLSSSIPVEIGNLQELVILLLSNNQLSGSLPIELSQLEKLSFLHLQNNQLTACFPEELRSICSIGETVNSLGYNFNNNPALPWSGDFKRFCNNESQIGASCDDSKPNTMNDVITADCICQGTVNSPSIESSSTSSIKTVSVIPNPFQATTSIHFQQKEGAWVKLLVYDISGKQVAEINTYQEFGKQILRLDETLLPQKGVYFYHLNSNEFNHIGKLIKH